LTRLRLAPIRSSVEERIEALAQAGLLSWSGKRLASHRPFAVARGRETVSGILLALRDQA
jgi:hypothetical protein